MLYGGLELPGAAGGERVGLVMLVAAAVMTSSSAGLSLFSSDDFKLASARRPS